MLSFDEWKEIVEKNNCVVKLDEDHDGTMTYNAYLHKHIISQCIVYAPKHDVEIMCYNNTDIDALRCYLNGSENFWKDLWINCGKIYTSEKLERFLNMAETDFEKKSKILKIEKIKSICKE